MASKVGSVFSYFFIDLAGSLVRFPLWWYTSGFLQVLRWIGRSLAFRWRSYNMRIWLKNFFVPMYGQYDWTGRLISVFMRLVILIGRFIALIVEAIVYVLLLGLWLASPPALLLLFLASLYQGTFVSQVRNLVP